MDTLRTAFTAVIPLALACAGPARADDIGFGLSYSRVTPSGGTSYSYTTPTIPFADFGLNFSASYQPRSVTAAFDGSTDFTLPTFSAGQVLNGATPAFAVGYSSSFQSSQLSGGADFTGGLNFHYAIGPFSGTLPIGSAAVAAPVAGSLPGNSPVSSATVNATATAPLPGFGLNLNALAASASASVTPVLKASTTLGFTPSFQYGYYEWVNTTGGLSASDTLKWVGVAAGSPLQYMLTPPASLQQNQTYFFNALPAVRLDVTLTQQQQLSLAVNLALNVSALGQTIIDYKAVLAQLSLLKNGYGFVDAGSEWVAGEAWSLPVRFNDKYYTVQGSSALTPQSLLTGHSGTLTLVPDSPGGFLPSPLTDAPPEPPVLVNGVPHSLGDPGLPLGPGTVTLVPEPATSWLNLAGLMALAAWVRARRSQPAASA